MNNYKTDTQKERLKRKFNLNKDDFNFEEDIDLLLKRRRIIKQELKMSNNLQSEMILEYIWKIDRSKTIKSFVGTQIKDKTAFERTLKEILYSQRDYYVKELAPSEMNRLLYDLKLDNKEGSRMMSLFESYNSIQLQNEHDSLFDLDPELRDIEGKIAQIISTVYQTMLLMFRKHDDRIMETLRIHEFKEIISICSADYKKEKRKQNDIREQYNPLLTFYFYMRSKYVMHYFDFKLVNNEDYNTLKFQYDCLPEKKVYSLADVASLLDGLMNEESDSNSQKRVYERLKKCFNKYKMSGKNTNGTYAFSDPLWPIANYLILKRKNKKHWNELSFLEDDSITYVYSVLQAMQAGESEQLTSMWDYIDFIKKEIDELVSFNPYPGHLDRIESLYALTYEIYSRTLFLGTRSL